MNYAHRLFLIIIIQTALITTSMAAENTSKIPTNSPGVRDLTSLSTQVEQDSHKLAFWTSAHFWLTAAVAIVGAFTIVSSLRLNKASESLSKSQAVLAEERDRLDIADSKSKDVLIAAAKLAAEEAKHRTVEIEKENLSVRAQLAKTAERAAALEKTAEDARKETREIQLQVASANERVEGAKKQNLATEERLEKERMVRIELEKSLTPRRLMYGSGPGVDSKFKLDALTKFAGTKVIVHFMNDNEVVRAAQSVGNILKESKWDIVEYGAREYADSSFFEGIIIFSPFFSSKHSEAAEALREFIAAQDIVVEKRAGYSQQWLEDNKRVTPKSPDDPGRPTLPDNTMKIVVGFKPNRHFEPEEVKEARKRIRESDEAFRKQKL